MFAGKKSAQIREILISESAWEEMTCLFALSLVQVLPEYYQPANVWAVYVSRLATSAKVRITVEFLRQYFAEHYPNFSLEHA